MGEESEEGFLVARRKGGLKPAALLGMTALRFC
jgi:hypothetical protein